jgi:V8-like Glu-specific endopeptidase
MCKNSLLLLCIVFIQSVIGCSSPPPMKEPTKTTKSESSPSPMKKTTKRTNPKDSNNIEKELESKAREFTVKIITKTGNKSATGTGYIFRNDNDIYSVLTVGHNVKFNESGSEMEVPNPTEADNKSKETTSTEIRLITSDEKPYIIEAKNISQPDESLDIAILKFKSNISYSKASFGQENSESKGSSVYLIGYKGCANKEDDDLELTVGKITESPNNQNDIYYTNATVTGMSGSPVMNDKGEIVGIHAYSSKQKDTLESDIKDRCVKINGNIYLGGNYGIPLRKFKNYLQPPKKI